MIKKETKKTKNLITDLSLCMIPSLAVMGVIGGVMKMSLFGNDEKTPQKLAEEMMAGAVRGILEHFEYKLDDLKRDVERKSEEIGKLKEKIEQYEEKEKSPKTTV
jgi:hypothetical protein